MYRLFYLKNELSYRINNRLQISVFMCDSYSYSHRDRLKLSFDLWELFILGCVFSSLTSPTRHFLDKFSPQLYMRNYFRLSS